MNIKLHNKYEITVGDKSYTAYNTITHNIFDAIVNFTRYARSFSIGDGTSNVDYNSDYMARGFYTIESELEDLQCDPSKGVMYVKRSVTIPKNGGAFTFTEIGITHENQTILKPMIYSHIFITDENGKVAAIAKTADEEMIIRVTLYLEIDEATKTFLTAGDNLLVKAILGELETTPKITVTRGYNNTPNDTFTYRELPRNCLKYDCSNSHTTNKDGTEQISYGFDVRSGETAELVLLFDDTPVARISTLGAGALTMKQMKDQVSQTNYTLDLGEYIHQVNAVQDANGNDVADYKIRKYARDFTDFIANPFEVDFTSECARWVSKDGNKIAFVANNTVYVYTNKNYALRKISNNIVSDNLKKIIMFEDYIFAIYSTNPYFKVYKIMETVAQEMQVDMTAYQTFDSSYAWQDVEIISDGQNQFLIGAILGEIARNPILVWANIEDNIFKATSAEYGRTDYIVNMFSLYRNNFCDSMIGFITNNYSGADANYRIEQHYIDGSYDITNELPAYYLCNGTVALEGKSRAVIAKKTSSPYIWLFYYPQVYRYSISLTEGVENWISTNLMYIIQKYDNAETPYKIYSLNDYNNPQEFINGFPSEIDLSTVTDFEFLDDTLIVFTTERTYAINLKQTHTVLENMPSANAAYNIEAVEEKLLGSDSTEGVMGSLSVVFTV